jgi:hypothetical protein
MPASSFDVKTALLLLDSDEDDEDDIEYVNAAQALVFPDVR